MKQKGTRGENREEVELKENEEWQTEKQRKKLRPYFRHQKSRASLGLRPYFWGRSHVKAATRWRAPERSRNLQISNERTLASAPLPRLKRGDNGKLKFDAALHHALSCSNDEDANEDIIATSDRPMASLVH